MEEGEEGEKFFDRSPSAVRSRKLAVCSSGLDSPNSASRAAMPASHREARREPASEGAGEGGEAVSMLLVSQSIRGGTSVTAGRGNDGDPDRLSISDADGSGSCARDGSLRHAASSS